MATCRRVTSFANKSRIYLYTSSKLCSNTAAVKSGNGQNEIIVPYKIKREPTDLLKALASTISKDYTAPQYKYEDDPYFIPISNVTKRSFALSKESGRKAARYFLENYSDIFKCNTSDPHIKAYDPPVTYTEDDSVSVDILKECIKDFDVKNSITVYQNLKKKEISVSQEIKQDLLELLCFYNSTPPPPDDFYEERFYARSDEKQIEKWKARGMAEMLFEDMEKDGKAYSALIAGASKFRDAVRTETLYTEMRSKELKGTVEAYNGLLSVVPLLQEMGDTRWEYVMYVLSHMSSDGLEPNLHTMNALLAILSKSRWNKSKATALKLLAEMKKLKIEPSLGTYYHVLKIFCADESRTPDIIYEIINRVIGQEFTIRHRDDVYFFATAMEMCWKIVHDKELAYQLHSLLEYKNNCKLLGNALSEAQYFKCFFRILCEKEDIDRVMEIYEKYVPNTYTPEPSVTFTVIEAIHFAGAYKYLPRLCSDVLVFEQSERENILNVLIETASCMKHEDQIQQQLIDMVWQIVEKINSRLTRRIYFNWSGFILGNILKIFMNGKDFEKSWLIIKQLKEEEQKITGYPEKDYLVNFCEFCLDEQDFEKANFCVKYAVNGAYPEFREDFEKLTDKMFEAERLNVKHRSVVDNILRKRPDIGEDTSSSESSSSDDSSSDDDCDDNEETARPPSNM